MALKKLREMLDSKEISAVELTEQYLDRIEKSDKEINSYITVCKENALGGRKESTGSYRQWQQRCIYGIAYFG